MRSTVVIAAMCGMLLSLYVRDMGAPGAAPGAAPTGSGDTPPSTMANPPMDDAELGVPDASLLNDFEGEQRVLVQFCTQCEYSRLGCSAHEVTPVDVPSHSLVWQDNTSATSCS